MREDLTTSLLERLGSHRLDAALVALPVPDARLETLPLFDEPFWFAEPKGRKPAAPRVMTENDLRGQRLLLLTEGHCLRDQALAICETSDGDVEGDFRATSLRDHPADGRDRAGQHAAAGDGLQRSLRPFGQRCIRWSPGSDGASASYGAASYSRLGDIRLLAKTVRDHLPQSVQRI